jgi:hypothetical protein
LAQIPPLLYRIPPGDYPQMREVWFSQAFSHRRDAEDAELELFFCSSLRPRRLCGELWVITKIPQIDNVSWL